MSKNTSKMTEQNQDHSLAIINKNLVDSIESKLLRIAEVERRSQLICELIVLESRFDLNRAKEHILKIPTPYFRAKGLLAIAKAEKKQGNCVNPIAKIKQRKTVINTNIKKFNLTKSFLYPKIFYVQIKT